MIFLKLFVLVFSKIKKIILKSCKKQTEIESFLIILIIMIDMIKRKKAMSMGFNLILTAIVGFSFIIIGFHFYSYLNQNATAKVNQELISYLKQVMFYPITSQSSSRLFSTPSKISYSLSGNKISIGRGMLESHIPVYSEQSFSSSKFSVFLSDFSPIYDVSPMLFIFPTNTFHVYLYRTPTTKNNSLRDETYNSLPPNTFNSEQFIDKMEIEQHTPLNYNAKTDKAVFVFLSSDSNTQMMKNLIPVINPNLVVLNITPSKDQNLGNITFYYYNQTSKSSETVTYPYLSSSMITSAVFSFSPSVYKKGTQFLMKRMLNVNQVYLERFKMINASMDKKCQDQVKKNFDSNPFINLNNSISNTMDDFNYANTYKLNSNITAITKASNNLIYSGCPSII